MSYYSPYRRDVNSKKNPTTMGSIVRVSFGLLMLVAGFMVSPFFGFAMLFVIFALRKR